MLSKKKIKIYTWDIQIRLDTLVAIFCLQVGLPAKSGISGCILLVVPNVMGICLWSPPLDTVGNSVKGGEFCKQLVKYYSFHRYKMIHIAWNEFYFECSRWN